MKSSPVGTQLPPPPTDMLSQVPLGSPQFLQNSNPVQSPFNTTSQTNRVFVFDHDELLPASFHGFENGNSPFVMWKKKPDSHQLTGLPMPSPPSNPVRHTSIGIPPSSATHQLRPSPSLTSGLTPGLPPMCSPNGFGEDDWHLPDASSAPISQGIDFNGDSRPSLVIMNRLSTARRSSSLGYSIHTIGNSHMSLPLSSMATNNLHHHNNSAGSFGSVSDDNTTGGGMSGETLSRPSYGFAGSALQNVHNSNTNRHNTQAHGTLPPMSRNGRVAAAAAVIAAAAKAASTNVHLQQQQQHSRSITNDNTAQSMTSSSPAGLGPHAQSSNVTSGLDSSSMHTNDHGNNSSSFCDISMLPPDSNDSIDDDYTTETNNMKNNLDDGDNHNGNIEDEEDDESDPNKLLLMSSRNSSVLNARFQVEASLKRRRLLFSPHLLKMETPTNPTNSNIILGNSHFDNGSDASTSNNHQQMDSANQLSDQQSNNVPQTMMNTRASRRQRMLMQQQHQHMQNNNGMMMASSDYSTSSSTQYHNNYSNNTNNNRNNPHNNNNGNSMQQYYYLQPHHHSLNYINSNMNSNSNLNSNGNTYANNNNQNHSNNNSSSNLNSNSQPLYSLNNHSNGSSSFHHHHHNAALEYSHPAHVYSSSRSAHHQNASYNNNNNSSNNNNNNSNNSNSKKIVESGMRGGQGRGNPIDYWGVNELNALREGLVQAGEDLPPAYQGRDGKWMLISDRFFQGLRTPMSIRSKCVRLLEAYKKHSNRSSSVVVSVHAPIPLFIAAVDREKDRLILQQMNQQQVVVQQQQQHGEEGEEVDLGVSLEDEQPDQNAVNNMDSTTDVNNKTNQSNNNSISRNADWTPITTSPNNDYNNNSNNNSNSTNNSNPQFLTSGSTTADTPLSYNSQRLPTHNSRPSSNPLGGSANSMLGKREEGALPYQSSSTSITGNLHQIQQNSTSSMHDIGLPKYQRFSSMSGGHFDGFGVSSVSVGLPTSLSPLWMSSPDPSSVRPLDLKSESKDSNDYMLRVEEPDASKDTLQNNTSRKIGLADGCNDDQRRDGMNLHRDDNLSSKSENSTSQNARSNMNGVSSQPVSSLNDKLKQEAPPPSSLIHLTVSPHVHSLLTPPSLLSNPPPVSSQHIHHHMHNQHHSNLFRSPLSGSVLSPDLLSIRLSAGSVPSLTPWAVGGDTSSAAASSSAAAGGLIVREVLHTNNNNNNSSALNSSNGDGMRGGNNNNNSSVNVNNNNSNILQNLNNRVLGFARPSTSSSSLDKLFMFSQQTPASHPSIDPQGIAPPPHADLLPPARYSSLTSGVVNVVPGDDGGASFSLRASALMSSDHHNHHHHHHSDLFSPIVTSADHHHHTAGLNNGDNDTSVVSGIPSDFLMFGSQHPQQHHNELADHHNPMNVDDHHATVSSYCIRQNHVTADIHHTDENNNDDDEDEEDMNDEVDRGSDVDEQHADSGTDNEDDDDDDDDVNGSAGAGFRKIQKRSHQKKSYGKGKNSGNHIQIPSNKRHRALASDITSLNPSNNSNNSSSANHGMLLDSTMEPPDTNAESSYGLPNASLATGDGGNRRVVRRNNRLTKLMALRQQQQQQQNNSSNNNLNANNGNNGGINGLDHSNTSHTSIPSYLNADMHSSNNNNYGRHMNYMNTPSNISNQNNGSISVSGSNSLTSYGGNNSQVRLVNWVGAARAAIKVAKQAAVAVNSAILHGDNSVSPITIVSNKNNSIGGALVAR